jgi:capsular polysaccharide biosynthesis protein
MIGADAQIEVVNGGCITRTRCQPEAHRFTGCVHYADGSVCERSQRSRRFLWKPADLPLSPGAIRGCRQRPATALYAGHLPAHFGHFLLETPSRLWCLDAAPPWDLLVFNRFVEEDSCGLQDEKLCSLLGAFGIDLSRVALLAEDTAFAEILVPDSLFIVGAPPHPLLRHVYARWKDHLLAGHQPSLSASRLYVSRWRLAQSRGDVDFDESRIEDFFRRHGFTVVYPETLPFVDQVAAFAQADVIAGLGGSALHLSVFMRPESQTLVLCTPRWPKANPVQTLCNTVSGARLSFYPFHGHAARDRRFRYEIDFKDLEVFLKDTASLGRW